MVMQRLQILVTEEQRAWLETESERRNMPVTALVRSAIDGARGVRPEARRIAAVRSLLGRPPGPPVPGPLVTAGAADAVDGLAGSRP